MGEDFYRYTYYIFSSDDPLVVPLSVHGGVKGDKKKILFFISDENARDVSDNLRISYLAIFKGYLSREMPSSNVLPFNIGYVKDVPELQARSIKNRPVNVFFSGNLNENRIEFYNAIHPILRHLPTSLAASAFRKYQDQLRTNFEKVFPHSHIQFTTGFKIRFIA